MIYAGKLFVEIRHNRGTGPCRQLDMGVLRHNVALSSFFRMEKDSR